VTKVKHKQTEHHRISNHSPNGLVKHHVVCYLKLSLLLLTFFTVLTNYTTL